MLAIGGFWLNQIQKNRDNQIEEKRAQTDRDIAADNQREKALQDYIDKISELLLKEHLGELEPVKDDGSEEQESKVKSGYENVRNIARVRTFTVLFQLDTRRIEYVFAFLREAGLMSNKPNSSIVSLSRANLHKINLSQAFLNEAILSEAILDNANFTRATVTEKQIEAARSYKGTIKPDGDPYPS
jgi:hypothetical protein